MFKNREYLVDSMKNFLKLKTRPEYKSSFNTNMVNENILIDNVDYYYSNVVARASKTMRECREATVETKKTGTEG